jgi:hypothetical protein
LKSPLNLGVSPQSNVDLNKYQDSSYIKTLLHISKSTNAYFIYTKNTFEIWGLRTEIKKAYTKLLSIDWFKKAIKQTKFQVELEECHREFFNGKKNGKLNKIMTTSGCTLILQEPYNGHNFLIELFQSAEQSNLIGFEMLEVNFIKSFFLKKCLIMFTKHKNRMNYQLSALSLSLNLFINVLLA